jgi:hypothetical protein
MNILAAEAQTSLRANLRRGIKPDFANKKLPKLKHSSLIPYFDVLCAKRGKP